MSFTRAVIYVAIYCNLHQGFSQRLLLDIGPRDITRTVGETDVYIPCPFVGYSSPLWVINKIHYEAFNLPGNMFAVSYGLLIPHVESSLNGTTFQCIVPSDSGKVYQTSDVGTLTVEEIPKEYRSLFKPSDYVPTGITASLNIDHQRTFFEHEFKSLSWTDVPECGGYQMTAAACSGAIITLWDENIIRGTTLSVPTTYLVDNNNRPLFFQLTAVDIDTGAQCENFEPYIVIKQSDVTNIFSASFGGFCFQLTSITGPYVVFPGRSHGRDCPCSIFFTDIGQNFYTLNVCSCGEETIFQDSFFVYKTQIESQSIYHVCFLNLTNEMNSTVIHFYELYRTCDDEQGSQYNKPYRQYFQSLKINIVLPDPPDVTWNSRSGYINFSSPLRDGISIDYYQLVILDITGSEVVNSSFYSHNTSVSDLFQQTTCSPYQVIVQAHNSYGSTDNNVTVIGDRPGDECHCIVQNVRADVVNLLEGVSGITVVINCSRTYVSDVTLNVTTQHMGTTINSTLVVCGDSTYNSITIESLKCDNVYDFLIFWSPAGENSPHCQMSVNRSQVLQCSDTRMSLYLQVIIIISSVSGFFILLLVVIIIIVIMICIYKIKKKGSVTIQ